MSPPKAPNFSRGPDSLLAIAKQKISVLQL